MESVKIIIADTQLVKGKEEYILTQIAPCYVEKHRGAKIKKDAEQELAAGYLLKLCLGINRDEQLTYNAYSKPSLASEEAFFNLSHSGDYVVLAIADGNIGVDVERIMDCHDATVKKVFSSKQKEKLLKLEGQEKDEKFTEMWTQCEAMLKLKGTGFGEEWDKEKAPAKCHLYTARIDDYMISCATERQAPIKIEKLYSKDIP